MNGPDHHHFAEQLAQEAYNRLGQGAEQSATAWAAVAQVHATLALAAAATARTTETDSQASAEAAGTEDAPFKAARVPGENPGRRRKRSPDDRDIGQGR